MNAGAKINLKLKKNKTIKINLNKMAHKSSSLMFLQASELLAGEAEHFAALAAQYRSQITKAGSGIRLAGPDTPKRQRGRPRVAKPWTEEDVARFREAVSTFGFVASRIHKHLGTHTLAEVKQRMTELLQAGLSAMDHGNDESQGDTQPDSMEHDQDEDHEASDDDDDDDGGEEEESDDSSVSVGDGHSSAEEESTFLSDEEDM